MTLFELGITLTMVLAALCGVVLVVLDFIKLIKQTKPLPPPQRAYERDWFKENCR